MASKDYSDLIDTLVPYVIHAESRGKANAVSPKGAQGIMQILPSTAAQYGQFDLNDPEQNIQAGTAHLRYLANKYDGDPVKMLAAYNAGEGPVDKYKGIPPYRETQKYVTGILGGIPYNQLHKEEEKANPFMEVSGEEGSNPFMEEVQASTQEGGNPFMEEAPPAGNVISSGFKENTPIPLSSFPSTPAATFEAVKKDEARNWAEEVAKGGAGAIGLEQTNIGLGMLPGVLEKGRIESEFGGGKKLPGFGVSEEEAAKQRAEYIQEQKANKVPFEMTLQGADEETQARYKAANEELLALARKDTALSEVLQEKGFGGQVGAGLLQNAPRMVAPLVAGAAAGGATPVGFGTAALVGAVMNSDIASRAYVEARQKGVTPEKSLTLAINEHAAEIIPDALLIGKFLTPGSSLLKKIMGGAVAGAVSEPISDVAQLQAENEAFKENLPYTWEQMGVSSSVGGLLGMAGGAVGGLVNQAQERSLPGILKQADMFLPTPGEQSLWAMRQGLVDKLKGLEEVPSPAQETVPDSQIDLFNPSTWGQGELFALTPEEQKLVQMSDDELLQVAWKEAVKQDEMGEKRIRLWRKRSLLNFCSRKL